MSSNCTPCEHCKEYTYRELDDLLYSIKTSMAQLGYADVLKKKYGYTMAGKFAFSVQKINSLTRSLERHMWYIYNNIEPCLCPRDVQLLVERVKEVVDFVCEEGCRDDVKIESNPYPILSNPECHYYEDWEKLLFKKCPQLTFSETVKQTCQVTFEDLLTKKCSTSILDEIDQKCELRLEDDAFVAGCKLEYDELSSKGCDFTYEEYLAGRCYEVTLEEQVQLCQDCENC